MEKKTTVLKRLLAAIIVLTLGVIVFIFVGYRRMAPVTDRIVSDKKKDAVVTLTKVEHTASRNGALEWKLKADSASYSITETKLSLDDIFAVFYVENDHKVFLTAKQGFLKTDTNDINVSEGVILTDEYYRMTTDDLNYQHKNRLLNTKGHVKIVGRLFSLEADAMTMDLENQKTILNGNVKGILKQNVRL